MGTSGEGFLRLVAVGYETAEEIHKAVWHSAMASVFDQGDALELVDNRFDHHPFTEEYLVHEG